MSKNKLLNIIFLIGLLISCIGFLMSPSNLMMMLIGSCLMVISNIS